MFCKTPTIHIPDSFLANTTEESDEEKTYGVFIGFLFDGVQNFTDLRKNEELSEYSSLNVASTPDFWAENKEAHEFKPNTPLIVEVCVYILS